MLIPILFILPIIERLIRNELSNWEFVQIINGRIKLPPFPIQEEDDDVDVEEDYIY
jgi:hypothetical protein